MANVDEALARIEAQRGDDAGVNEVCDFLAAWVESEEEAAARSEEHTSELQSR